MATERYITIAQYAKLSGVSHQAIYDRIHKSGSIELTEVEVLGKRFRCIDTWKYPVRKGRQTNSEK